MSKPLRCARALSAIALASVIAGCATHRSASFFGGKDGKGDVGLAMRALMALNANDFAAAVNLAERSVEKSPNDAGFRALLGNSYFASGRFASAEAAYRDSIALVPNQPQVVLRLALVEIAQGRHADALYLLGQAGGMLEPADYGLALALAGKPREAAAALEAAARQPGADARLRQNLALAHALCGDWDAARAVAAQDLSADLLDARIQQWMSFAKPNAAADQVAALTGIKPAAGDPGQPIRLALRGAATRMAQVAPVAPQPQQVAAYAPPPVAEPTYAPQFDQLGAAPAPQPEVAPEPPPVVEAAAAAPAPSFEAPAPEAATTPVLSSSVKVKLPRARPASFAAEQRAAVRKAALVRGDGKANVVVQLGAYGSRERVTRAWDMLTRRHPALRGYSPVTARFDSRNGPVYRLSIKGFDNQREAIGRCRVLRGNGGNCFVRHVAGDVPVRMASR